MRVIDTSPQIREDLATLAAFGNGDDVDRAEVKAAMQRLGIDVLEPAFRKKGQ